MSAPPGNLSASESIEGLYAEVLRLARENLTLAAERAEAAIALAEHLDEPCARGLAARARANVRYLRGEHQAAMDDYCAALQHFQQGAETQPEAMEVEIARTESSAIQTLAYLARYDEALQWCRHARDVFARHGDTVRLARLEGNLANLYFRLDRFEEALASYERARDVFEAAGSAQDVAAVLSNLATCYISVARFDDSLRTHQQAREHSLRHGFSLLAAQADYNIAYAHLLRGDHREALRLYAAARKHAHAVGDSYHTTLCDLDQAEMMLELNQPEEAAGLARSAMRGFRRLNMRYERAKAAVFRAQAAARIGQQRMAVRTFRLARQLFELEGNTLWPAMVDLHLALLDAELEDLPRARKRAQAALLAFSQRQLPAQIVMAELVLSRVLSLEGALPQAEALAQSARNRAGRIGSGGLRYRTEFWAGELRHLQGDGAAAMVAWQRAAEALEWVRDGLPEEELRIRFLEDKAALFERLVEAHLQGSPSEADLHAAYGWVQRAKSRAFLDALSGDKRDGDGDPGTLPVLRRQLHEAYLRQAEAERKAAGANASSVEAQRWRSLVKELETRFQQELSAQRLRGEQGRTMLPGAADLTQIASADAIADCLLPGETLLEYFTTSATVYVFLLEAGKPLRMFALGSAAELRNLTRLALFQISSYHFRRLSGAPPEESSPALCAHLQRLFQQLIQPLLPHVSGRRLLLAPHGFLHGLPFAALGTPADPLLRRFSLRRTLSGSALLALSRRMPLPEPSQSMVFGVPDEQAPFIRQEAEEVAALLPAAGLHLEREATLGLLRERAPSCRYLHIASHGLFRSDNPMFSAIRLGDGNLNLFELEDIRIPAELVALSGCSTGVNAVVGGDELIGLTRGFLRAGAQNLLVTLWDVSDGSTREFMAAFYRRLANEGSVVDCMQDAAMELRERFPHPYHWAAFSLMSADARPPGETA